MNTHKKTDLLLCRHTGEVKTAKEWLDSIHSAEEYYVLVRVKYSKKMRGYVILDDGTSHF